VTLDDWILSLHVLSAAALVGGMGALWAVLLATRPAAAGLPGGAAAAVAVPASAAVGVGLIGTIVFGVWLAISLDAYHPWDPWLVASLVLWLAAGGLGDRSRAAFRELAGGGGAGDWGRVLRSHAAASVVVVVLLAVMIWKPGA
jgi:hypothetical protein